MKTTALLANHKVLLHPPWGRMNTRDRLLHACLMAYAKHHLDSQHIGWNQVSDTLHNAICEAVGDESYCEWSDRIKSEADTPDLVED